VREIPTAFFLRLLSRHFYPRVAIVPTIRTIFSLIRLVAVDTWHIYGIQQFLYWRIRISVRYTGPHLTTVLRALAFTGRQSFPAYDRRISERAHVAYKQQRELQ
jgi:hypothetical protein